MGIVIWFLRVFYKLKLLCDFFRLDALSWAGGLHFRKFITTRRHWFPQKRSSRLQALSPPRRPIIFSCQIEFCRDERWTLVFCARVSRILRTTFCRSPLAAQHYPMELIMIEIDVCLLSKMKPQQTAGNWKHERLGLRVVLQCNLLEKKITDGVLITR